jgi:hypothetical protein
MGQFNAIGFQGCAFAKKLYREGMNNEISPRSSPLRTAPRVESGHAVENLKSPYSYRGVSCTRPLRLSLRAEGLMLFFFYFPLR